MKYSLFAAKNTAVLQNPASAPLAEHAAISGWRVSFWMVFILSGKILHGRSSSGFHEEFHKNFPLSWKIHHGFFSFDQVKGKKEPTVIYEAWATWKAHTHIWVCMKCNITNYLYEKHIHYTYVCIHIQKFYYVYMTDNTYIYSFTYSLIFITLLICLYITLISIYLYIYNIYI